MKYSTSSSTGLSLFDSDLGVSLFNSVSSIVPVAVPGKGTNVAVALDDDDNDVLSEASRHSSMLNENVTLLDVLLAFGAILTSDQSASSYIAWISCDDEAAEDLTRCGGSGGLGLGRGTVNPVRYGLGRITFGDPGPLHSLLVSGDLGRMM